MIADSPQTTTVTAFMLIRSCLFLMFYRFTKTTENLLGKIYIECAIMSISSNIALIIESVTIFNIDVNGAFAIHELCEYTTH